MSRSKKRLPSERIEELFAELQATPPERAEEAPGGEETSAPVVRFQCDGQGRLLTFDKALAHLLGYEESALLGLPLSRLIPDLETHPLYRAAISEKQEIAGLEVQVRDARGLNRSAVLYLSPHSEHTPVALDGVLQFQRASSATPPPPPPTGTRFLGAMAAQERLQGVLLQGDRLAPAQRPLTPAGQQALQQKTLVALAAQSDQPAALAAPVPLPDAPALLEIVDPSPERVWDEDEQQLAAEVAQQLALALENARLFQAAQRRATELQALLNLTRAVTQELKLEEVYRATDQALQQLMTAETILIGLVNEGQDGIELVYGRDREHFIPPGRQIPLQEGLSGYVIQRAQPVRVKDFEDTASLPFRPRTLRTGYDEKVTRSAVAAPLRIGERVIGMLSVQSYRPNAYTQADLNLLVGVADQIALAIQNARLFEQTQRALTATAELYRLTASFNAAATYEDILKALWDFLGPEVHSLAISVFEHPWDEQGPPPRWIQPLAYLSELEIPQEIITQRYPLEEFPEAKRLRSGGDFIADIAEAPWSENTFRLYAGVLQAKAAAFIPLMVSGRWIGFLNVLYRQPHPFSQEERQQIVAVASQAAVAVENLRALENIRRQAQELDALNRLAHSLSESLDPLTVYRTALEGVRTLFDVDAGLVSAALSPDAQTLELVASLGLPAEMEARFRSQGIDVQTTACGWTFLQERPVVLPDLALVDYPFAQALREMGFQAYLGLPLRYGEENLGTMCLFRKEPYLPSTEALQLLETVGREVAVAAANARLYQQAQTALAETERLYDLSRALSQAHSYAEVLEVLRTQTPLGEGASNISLNFFNRPWTEFEDIPEWSIVKTRWTRLPAERLAPRYPLRAFPTVRLFWAAEPLIFTDVATDPRLDERTRALYLHQFGAQSTVFFPLVVGGRRIGYINAIYDSHKEFSDEDLRFLNSAIAQAAVTLENLILLERAQRRAEAERTIRGIASEIFKAPRTEETLQTAARLLAHALGVTHAQVHLLGTQEGSSLENLNTSSSPQEEQNGTK